MNNIEKKLTQKFSITNILCNHTNKILTHELIIKITEELHKEINDSPTAWAFSKEYE